MSLKKDYRPHVFLSATSSTTKFHFFILTYAPPGKGIRLLSGPIDDIDAVGITTTYIGYEVIPDATNLAGKFYPNYQSIPNKAGFDPSKAENSIYITVKVDASLVHRLRLKYKDYDPLIYPVPHPSPTLYAYNAPYAYLTEPKDGGHIHYPFVVIPTTNFIEDSQKTKVTQTGPNCDGEVHLISPAAPLPLRFIEPANIILHRYQDANQLEKSYFEVFAFEPDIVVGGTPAAGPGRKTKIRNKNSDTKPTPSS